VEVRLICRKLSFSPIFWTTLCLCKILPKSSNPSSHHTGSPGIDTSRFSYLQVYPSFPSSFNLRNLDERDLPTAPSPVAQNLSVTGDMAKYTQFLHSAEVCTLYPHDLVEKANQDETFSEVGPRALRTDPFQPTQLHLLVTSGQVPTTYLVKTEPIWRAVVHGSF